jgi:hypothetical protein
VAHRGRSAASALARSTFTLSVERFEVSIELLAPPHTGGFAQFCPHGPPVQLEHLDGGPLVRRASKIGQQSAGHNENAFPEKR